MSAPLIRRLATTVVGAIAVAGLLLWAFPVHPHDAAAGWSYPLLFGLRLPRGVGRGGAR